MYISVIIPMYNSEKFLEECLDSVKACSEQNIECIMVNDGSTDKTEEICNEYIKTDSRFKLINKENTGVSDSRNIGIENAAGKYIFFLDADDYIKSDVWQIIIDYAKNSSYDAVAFAYTSLFRSGNSKDEIYSIDSLESDKLKDIHYALLATPMLNTCWGKLLKSEIIRKNDIRFQSNLKTCEDAVFIVDFVQSADSILLRNDSVLCYRINENGAMQNINIIEKLYDFNILYKRRNQYCSYTNDEDLKGEIYRHYFSVITDLLIKEAAKQNVSSLPFLYAEVITHFPVTDILSNTDKKYLSPFYKKVEYVFLKNRWFLCCALYFKFKSLFI